MKKIDFTIKGTKLPTIPKGTECNVIGTSERWARKSFTDYDLFSFGIGKGGHILAEGKDYNGEHPYIFKLATIEALAEEQGMLYEKEEERDWTGVSWVNNKEPKYSGKIISKGISDYLIHYAYSNENEEVNINVVNRWFTKGIWIEVKEEPKPIAEKLDINLLSSDANIEMNIPKFARTTNTTPSLRDLIETAGWHERNIRKGCPMWEGVDEAHRLKQVEQEWSKLREVVKQLDNILNEKK